ncbi:N-acyl-L-amino acid amidohydrolase [Micrococcus luteus]|uniref:amidohydrolase n=1 Tax=Micrococcus TaxID=1269 RepID=UPI000BACA9A1|nr:MULTISPECIES: amidohydrolase [Micrococcus]MCV7741263.1 amidohydrolase [Micrococcus luteus]PAW32782.1 N-acyl-L-amino acid amidohydrolase [Micrococcus luteus]
MTTSDSVLTGPRPTSVPSVGPVVAELEDEIVSFRRDLHRHPELSYEEYRTTDRIVELLSGYGLSPVRMESTGAYVDVGEGPVVLALRADIDALPVEEETGLPYVSVNDGVAHACGHDMHTAVMAGVAVALGRILRGATADADLRAAGERVHGTVRVIFQPAEERLPGGSLAVLRQGILDDVPRILAAHCDPQVDVGSIGTRIGAITSAADTIRITLTGRGGHTSRPHLTEDMVFALSQIAVNVPAVLSRRIDVRSAVSVVWGQIAAGSAPNAIDNTGYLAGTMRCLDADVWEEAGALLDEVVRQVAAPYGVHVQLEHVRGVPPVHNTEGETALIETAARRELGSRAILLTPQSMGGEDFAWMTQQVPGSMLRLGTRSPGGPIYDLHRGDYAPDERAIGVGMRVFTAAALQVLTGEDHH